jgi:hypothetical protein
MEHISASHIGNGLNGPLCNTILMNGTNTIEMQRLPKITAG